MNILDNIINGEEADINTPSTTNTPNTPNTQTVAAAHDFRAGAVLSDDQIENARRKLTCPSQYRGQGVNVHTLNNHPASIAEAAGLNWKTVPVQLAMRGRTETREIDGMRALVRSDNGTFLAVASDKYKPHQNSDLLSMMAGYANANGLTISRVGQWDGGKRIWAVAQSSISADVKVGDTFALQLVIRGGHEPGVATSVRGVAMRLICSNGAMVSDTAVRVRWTHNSGLQASRLRATGEAIAKWSGYFDRYMADMARLYAVPLPKLAARVYLADVIQPDLIEEIARTLHVERRADLRAGAAIVERMLDSDRDARVVSQILTRDAGRLLRAVTQATASQVGGEYSQNTLAHGYNGITYYNSHVRGRDGEAALESQLFGEGGRMAHAARAVAVEYASHLAPRMGGR